MTDGWKMQISFLDGVSNCFLGQLKVCPQLKLLNLSAKIIFWNDFGLRISGFSNPPSQVDATISSQSSFCHNWMSSWNKSSIGLLHSTLMMYPWIHRCSEWLVPIFVYLFLKCMLDNMHGDVCLWRGLWKWRKEKFLSLFFLSVHFYFPLSQEVEHCSAPLLSLIPSIYPFPIAFSMGLQDYVSVENFYVLGSSKPLASMKLPSLRWVVSLFDIFCGKGLMVDKVKSLAFLFPSPLPSPTGISFVGWEERPFLLPPLLLLLNKPHRLYCLIALCCNALLFFNLFAQCSKVAVTFQDENILAVVFSVMNDILLSQSTFSCFCNFSGGKTPSIRIASDFVKSKYLLRQLPSDCFAARISCFDQVEYQLLDSLWLWNIPASSSPILMVWWQLVYDSDLLCEVEQLSLLNLILSAFSFHYRKVERGFFLHLLQIETLSVLEFLWFWSPLESGVFLAGFCFPPLFLILALSKMFEWKSSLLYNYTEIIINNQSGILASFGKWSLLCWIWSFLPFLSTIEKLKEDSFRICSTLNHYRFWRFCDSNFLLEVGSSLSVCWFHLSSSSILKYCWWKWIRLMKSLSISLFGVGFFNKAEPWMDWLSNITVALSYFWRALEANCWFGVCLVLFRQLRILCCGRGYILGRLNSL